MPKAVNLKALKLSTAQMNQLTTLRPLILTYFQAILPAYQLATPEKKLELRSHNPLLDLLCTIWGE